jgi:hypothetical protein
MSSIEELTCIDFVRFVGGCLDGAPVDSARLDSLELHEAGCAGCSRYHRQLRVTRELIAGQRRHSIAELVPLGAPDLAASERRAAFKFLRSGAVGPFTGFRWPVGEWVQAGQPPTVCVSGIHACLLEDLSYWLNDELWRVELGEPVQAHEHKLVGASGRLVEQVTAWDETRARRFAEDCAEVVNRLAKSLEPDWRKECEDVLDEFLADADLAAAPAVAALATYLSGRSGGNSDSAGERARQASWLANELGLGGM